MDILSLNKYDFFIFSSHKTSTQTILWTLRNNGYKALHIHTITDFNIVLNIRRFKLKKDALERLYLKGLSKYKFSKGKKLKIISVIREPYNRCISSFFQRNHDDMSKSKLTTIIMKYDIDKLIEIFYKSLEDELLYSESIIELSRLLKVDILSNMIDKGDHYYFEHDLCIIYVLKFNKVISNDSLDLEYINNVLNINLTKLCNTNITSTKIYYDKFKLFKEKVINNERYINIINDKYKNTNTNTKFFLSDI